MAPKVRIGKENGDKLYGGTIDFLVGSDEKIYGVHEALVRASSAFFDKSMAGEWKESVKRTVRLPDDDPRIFSIYVHWLYYGTLPVLCDGPDEPSRVEHLEIVKAYILGDRLLDTSFQNATIDAFVEKSQSTTRDGVNWYPGHSTIDYVYQNTTDSAPLRKLIEDMYADIARSAWLYRWADSTTIPQ